METKVGAGGSPQKIFENIAAKVLWKIFKITTLEHKIMGVRGRSLRKIFTTSEAIFEFWTVKIEYDFSKNT